MFGESNDGFQALYASVTVEDGFPLVIEQHHAMLSGNMLPQIGGPEAAASHHADTGNAFFRLVQLRRQTDHFFI